MSGSAFQKPDLTYWAIVLFLVLWGALGLSIYVAYFFFESPAEFARTAEDAAHREAYARYAANIPAWALALAVLAAVTRFLGALCLLLRRGPAVMLYALSLALFLSTLVRAFVFDTAASAMSVRHVGIEIAFVALGAFAVWFSWRSRAHGILK